MIWLLLHLHLRFSFYSEEKEASRSYTHWIYCYVLYHHYTSNAIFFSSFLNTNPEGDDHFLTPQTTTHFSIELIFFSLSTLILKLLWKFRRTRFELSCPNYIQSDSQENDPHSLISGHGSALHEERPVSGFGRGGGDGILGQGRKTRQP